MGHLSDSDRIRILNTSPLFNASIVNYYKDLRVKDGMPSTYFHAPSLDIFAQSLEWDVDVFNQLK